MKRTFLLGLLLCSCATGGTLTKAQHCDNLGKSIEVSSVLVLGEAVACGLVEDEKAQKTCQTALSATKVALAAQRAAFTEGCSDA